MSKTNGNGTAMQVKAQASTPSAPVKMRSLVERERDALQAAIVAQGRSRHESIAAWRAWRQAQKARQEAIALVAELWAVFDACVDAGEFARAEDCLNEMWEIGPIS